MSSRESVLKKLRVGVREGRGVRSQTSAVWNAATALCPKYPLTVSFAQCIQCQENAWYQAGGVPALGGLHFCRRGGH